MMRQILPTLLALIVTPILASAQTAAGPSRADIGLYVGGSWSSSWLAAGGDGLGIGFNPSFGGFVHGWVNPRFGARAHLGYVPSGLPGHGDAGVFDIPDDQMHSWIYDLSLAVRPFAGPGISGTRSSIYLFVGGGALTPNVEGGAAGECVPPYDIGDACLPYGWDATVVQFTAGFGTAAIPITSRVGLFLETALHGYPSPFRLGPEWTGHSPCPAPGCAAERRVGQTVRLVGGLALALRPPPPPAPLMPPPPAFPAASPEEPLVVCVMAAGFPRYVDVLVRPTERDTVVVTEQGIRRPLRSAFPTARPPSASGLEWHERGEPVFLDGREYVRFGAPREVSSGELSRIGEFRGIPVYAASEDPASGVPTDIFVPVRDGCVFQPYQMRQRVRVRS